MKTILEHLEWVLIAAAVGQLVLAAINLRLVKILGWEEDLRSMSLLVREVFHVHKWFISITLVIFAVLTLRFPGDLAGGSELGRWLAGCIGAFWGIRTWMQWAYYSPSHRRESSARMAVHWALTICYGGAAMAYLCGAFFGEG
ncbi:hypothetical protein BH23VER1_BH23VER1_03470 [soil metagenome]